MTITARVIAYSEYKNHAPIITVEARYPRFIHAEAKTHRVMRIDDAEVEFLQEVSLMDDENLSRNASSSRAIPIDKMIQQVLDDPAFPVEWSLNQPGMQGGNVLSDADAEIARMIWLQGRDNAVSIARALQSLGLHKQFANRVIEPYGHISVVITATEWSNFFYLRMHSAADPTMRALAKAIWDAIEQAQENGTCVEYTNASDAFHAPYLSKEERDKFDFGRRNAKNLPDREKLATEMALVSAGRTARVSYLNHDGTSPDPKKDRALALQLLRSAHMSPFEHQARALPNADMKSNNFRGWAQFRGFVDHTANRDALLVDLDAPNA